MCVCVCVCVCSSGFIDDNFNIEICMFIVAFFFVKCMLAMFIAPCPHCNLKHIFECKIWFKLTCYTDMSNTRLYFVCCWVWFLEFMQHITCFEGVTKRATKDGDLKCWISVCWGLLYVIWLVVERPCRCRNCPHRRSKRCKAEQNETKHNETYKCVGIRTNT